MSASANFDWPGGKCVSILRFLREVYRHRQVLRTFFKIESLNQMIRMGYYRSDESMNSGSINTKDLLDDDKESQSNSDQDVPIWATRGRNNGRGENIGDSGGEFAPANSSNPKPTRNEQPPWLEKVRMTPDLMYRYRIPAVDISDVLQKDLEALKIFGKVCALHKELKT